MPRPAHPACRRYLARGRVQGVGYRAFVVDVARRIGLTGYVRNLSDGTVEAVAAGTSAQLDEFAGHLHRGPRWSDVRGLEETEHPLLKSEGFFLKH
jgi:acylphosphatase